MDPLMVLREFVTEKKTHKIVREDDMFIFDSTFSFPCSKETAYASMQNSYYTLETLIFYLENADLKFTDYLQKARAQGIPAISYLHRQSILEYFTGSIESTRSIVVPLPHQQQNPSEYRPEDTGLFEVLQGGDLKEEDLMSKISAIERPLRDRDSLMESKNQDFYSILVDSMKREEERQRAESHQRKDGLVAKTRLMGSDDRGIGYGDDGGYESTPRPKMNLNRTKIREGVPIILVPSASQTLITIYNVKEFLEEGIFVASDVKKKEMQGNKPECITVRKSFSTDRNRAVTAYEVRDRPSTLKPEDWDRVVAVFVLGKEWQFKDWPFKNHAEIFSKLMGFYMRFEDDNLESAKNVKQWNVKIISISKTRRHQDRAAALEFWDKLEQFVSSQSHP